jgi:hypothetical protein
MSAIMAHSVEALHTIAVLSGLLDMGIQYGAPWIKNRE